VIQIDCYGGQVGRLRWVNSDRGGFFRQSGESCTSFRPGRCGWDEAWPDRYSWPVSPWGKGDAVDEHWRDFTAFEPWLDRQLEGRKLNRIDLNITEKIELYDMLCGMFKAGIDAGRNPWSWAEHVEQQTQSIQEEP
jgi:hypothetical protein